MYVFLIDPESRVMVLELTNDEEDFSAVPKKLSMEDYQNYDLYGSEEGTAGQGFICSNHVSANF
jgi:hypothetical protein